MHRVFVYGTLKRGFENHGLLAHSLYVGNAHTLDRFRMIHGRFPVLRDAGPDRHPIEGEVYEVDEATMAQLDELEGVDEHIYDRRTIGIAMADGSGGSQAFAYIGCSTYWDTEARANFTALTSRGHLDWSPGPDSSSAGDPA